MAKTIIKQVSLLLEREKESNNHVLFKLKQPTIKGVVLSEV